MELALIISLIVAVWNIVKFFIDHRTNKNKNIAEAENIHLSSSTFVVNQLRDELFRQADMLKELKAEIELLKRQEKLHFLEKIRLEEKVRNLISENKKLRIMVEANKESYTGKIFRLNQSVSRLTNELKIYKAKHNAE